MCHEDRCKNVQQIEFANLYKDLHAMTKSDLLDVYKANSNSLILKDEKCKDFQLNQEQSKDILSLLLFKITLEIIVNTIK
jgi:hypothetical protein